MKHELRRRCVRWLEKHWKRHAPEEHHLYLYDRNETVAVPEMVSRRMGIKCSFFRPL